MTPFPAENFPVRAYTGYITFQIVFRFASTPPRPPIHFYVPKVYERKKPILAAKSG